MDQDLADILQELTEVASYWLTVGVFLKVPYPTLETIRKDHHDQSKDCLREMVVAWLRGSEASPAVLVQALRAAGYVGLAKKLALKHGESRI